MIEVDVFEFIKSNFIFKFLLNTILYVLLLFKKFVFQIIIQQKGTQRQLVTFFWKKIKSNNKPVQALTIFLFILKIRN